MEWWIVWVIEKGLIGRLIVKYINKIDRNKSLYDNNKK